ncbi:cupin domain-containing protein [Moorena producens]|uniref:cupin domain-containing protein n=1 Tax=Moorena producens TaxID=1155739 RepID=UPI003C71162F
MGLIKKFECIQLTKTQEGGINFFSLQFTPDTFLYEIAPQTIDDLFCHPFQTDQLLVVQGKMVLVCLQNHQYHYILMTQHVPQVIKIPNGIPHLVINLTCEPCWVINTVIRHGDPHPKDYQPGKKPFPLDMEKINQLFSQ